MPRKPKKYKSKKGKDPESSTPETSINSVDDDTQQLLQSGAGASTDGRKSRTDEKTKRDGRWTLQGNPSPYQSLDATSSRNSPQPGHSSAQSGRSTDPDPESSTSYSKNRSLNPIKKLWRKISPSRSTGTECSCEDGNHKPECPKSKDLPVDPKGASGGARQKTYIAKKDEDATKSSSSFGKSISKTFSAKKNKGTQSSSSYDPSASEYFKSTREYQRYSERSLLLDPNQGSEVHSTRPSKEITRASWIGDKLKTKRQENRSAGTESSFEDNTNEELKWPEQRRHKMDLRNKSPKGKTPSPKQAMSEASSSRGSTTSTKNKNSKSSKSDPKGKRPLKDPSGNKSSNESKSNKGPSSISTDFDPFEELFRLAAARDERTQQQVIDENEPEIQNDIFIDEMDLGRRRRISSRSSRSHLLESEVESPRHQSPRPFNLREMSDQIKEIDFERLEERRRREADEEIDSDEEIDANEERKASVDEDERLLLRRLRKVKRPDPEVLRNPSSSPVRVRPCSCRAGRTAFGHSRYCAQERDLSRRRRKRKNRYA